ncbi:hypothetical protein RRG08_021858 [Elysia crispata]|uniref:Uncharacterized protein n=1 Tax=Elysia crispata TaxID=231223 RepID=A0AAE1D4I2_9GAST|nr:hypothetical protein RRG08_021858 [Elysia crispata]
MTRIVEKISTMSTGTILTMIARVGFSTFYNIIEDTRPKQKRREYFFTNKNGHRIKVCAAFFLRTLEYSSNSVIKCLEKSSPAENIFVRPDQRGKHKPAHA